MNFKWQAVICTKAVYFIQDYEFIIMNVCDILIVHLNNVSGVVFYTTFDGQTLFESCDCSNSVIKAKVSGKNSERIFGT